MKYTKFIDEERKEVVFRVKGIIEVRMDRKIYERYARKYSDEEIISFSPHKEIYNAITGRKMYYITEESEIPLIGHTAFGIIDRGTNLLQVRPISGCNLNCIFCSVDEGKSSTRVTDYMVDVDYILHKFEEVVDYKRKHCRNISIEAHIDGQGEPFLYPEIEELIKKLKEMADIVSIQTNGLPLNEKRIRRLEGYLDRVNLSIHAVDGEIAKRMSGISFYNIEHVLKMAEIIASSDIDLLLAPVWVPGYNDGEIKKIMEFGRRIGAGKKWKAFGIQKYVRYRFGRKPEGVKIMDFKTFYRKLEEMGEGLRLFPSDFGIVKCKSLPKKFRVGERVKLTLEMEGRVKGEMIGVGRERLIQVIDTSKRVGDAVRVEIIRNKHNIYVAREI